MMMRLATSLLTVLLIAGVALAAEEGRYLVKLDAAAAVDRADAIGAELAGAYGGTVDAARSTAGDEVVLRIPPARLAALQADPRVKLVSRLRSAANAVAEVVSWSAGVPYSYDGASNVVRIGDDEFLYDDVDRLVRAKVNGTTRSYDYDAFGNRKDCTQGDGTKCQFEFGTTSSNNHLTNVTYDSLGSGTVTVMRGHTYSWDAIQVMTSDQSSGSTLEFLYTANDERLATHNTGSGSWQWTLRDGGDRVVRELSSQDSGGSLGSWTWTRDYVWRDGLLLASRQRENTLVTTYHYHLDHLGTARRVTDGNDDVVGFHDYFAFGPEVFGGVSEPSRGNLRYAGNERSGEAEPVMLDYLHARYDNPTVGRFLSVDPIVNVKASIPNPQMWNRYTYAANNPMNLVDRDGKWASIVFHVHQDAIDISLPFVDENQRAILRSAQERVDLDQAHQYKHAMRLPGQSIEEARAQAQAFVNASMEKAVEHYLKGNTQMAMEHLGAAIHTLQDATSPSHAGFQVFDPSWSSTSPQVRAHVMAETRDPGVSFGTGPGLNAVTFRAWAYFAHRVGIPVPSTPLSLTAPDPSSHALIEVP